MGSLGGGRGERSSGGELWGRGVKRSPGGAPWGRGAELWWGAVGEGRGALVTERISGRAPGLRRRVVKSTTVRKKVWETSSWTEVLSSVQIS